jgi:hypothetical protein
MIETVGRLVKQWFKNLLLLPQLLYIQRHNLDLSNEYGIGTISGGTIPWNTG